LRIEQKRLKIDPFYEKISISRQCQLLGLARRSYYYQMVVPVENLRLMVLIDEIFTARPYYGKRRIWCELRNKGEQVNIKRVGRLMGQMGLEAVYPKPNLSRPAPWSKSYPYLLRGLSIERPDQVWASDITYIRLSRGFVYLVVVLDWYSRYVISWRLSNTLEADFCVDALNLALKKGRPEIFNTDQGSQFTSAGFLDALKSADIKISLDGRGRAFDNIMVERLWRSVKYEEVYLSEYQNVNDVKVGLGNYFKFYNEQRPHQSLAYQTPSEKYHQRTSQ
jgi:putative transposase